MIENSKNIIKYKITCGSRQWVVVSCDITKSIWWPSLAVQCWCEPGSCEIHHIHIYKC